MAYSRLDHFLNESLLDMSRTRVVQLIKEGHIKLNDQLVSKKNIHLREGDIVDVELVEEEKEEREDYFPTIELKKLFEDDHLLIIDKPCGLPVHPGSGQHRDTILDVFRFHYPQINEIPDTERPGIVHRLDKDTSGVLLLAKDNTTVKRLQKQFKRREVKKTYLALVAGHLRYRNGTIDAPIARSPRNRTKYKVVGVDDTAAANAREAVTPFSVIREYRDFSLVKLFPLTGRTHQIRVHLSYYGNPILGDRFYGKGDTFERLALHAYSLECRHPITGQWIISYSPFPSVFRDFLKSFAPVKINC
jgi:23S rRNA pseudouridine1911/1915/1917 synthase